MRSSPGILFATVLQGMQSVIQVAGNRVQDMSAEHADRRLITSTIVQLRIKDPPVEIGLGTVEIDVVLRRRSDVSA